jgi:N-acetylglucosamine PTS system EIICBA or EIICB component
MVIKMKYILLLIALFIIVLAVLKANRKDIHLDMNKLIDYLGGKDNIISTEVNLSRFKVNLRDITLVNKDAIQKLGAKGIVEIDNQLKIILGPNSKQLKKYIDDLK